MLSKRSMTFWKENAVGAVHSFLKEIISSDVKTAPALGFPGFHFSSAVWHQQGAYLLPELLPAFSQGWLIGNPSPRGKGRAEDTAHFPHLSGKEQNWVPVAYYPALTWERHFKKGQWRGMGLRNLLVQNSQFTDEKMRPEEWLLCPGPCNDSGTEGRIQVSWVSGSLPLACKLSSLTSQ